MTRVLLLGGTAEARALAAALVDAGFDVVSSLAGRVSKPRMPVGDVRVGGFGGVDGLAAALVEGGFTHLVDATHPFAVRMTANAGAASTVAGVPCLRLARPGWSGHPDARSWHWVDGYDEARRRAEELGAERPFITTGRQTLEHYSSWTDRDVVLRVVEPLDEEAPGRWTVLLDRGPFGVEDERALMTSAPGRCAAHQGFRWGVHRSQTHGRGRAGGAGHRRSSTAGARRRRRGGLSRGSAQLARRCRRITRALTTATSAAVDRLRRCRVARGMSSTVTGGPSPRWPRSSSTPS